MNNEIRELPNAVTECPTISTLLLQENKELEEIPDRFLTAFMSLKILDLSNCHIKSLPPCFDQLVELRALVLHYCRHLETLPPLGRLSKLHVLVCSETKIATLPQGMEKLTSLKLLNLSRNFRLTAIPAGLMSSLSNLEYLDMSGNDQLKFIGERGEISTLFEEILSLDRLIALFTRLGSSACTVETSNALLNRMTKFKKFELSIGFPSSNHFFLAKESKKNVILWGIHVWGERLEWLFANTTCINFYMCQGLDNMFEKLVANSDEIGCFDTVEIIYIYSCTDWVGIGNNAKFDMLPNLENISLYNLTHISCISEFALPLGLKLSRLRCIDVETCEELKYLISLGTTIVSLVKLERILVYSCEQVEQLFKFDQSWYPDFVFPNLKKIKLSNCPKLRFLSEQNVACPRLEEVEVQGCPLLKKLPLATQNVGTIKTIRGEQEWWDQLEWNNDDIKNNLQPCFEPF
ncbi:putative disease resistance protein [Sesamum alatum]|uniref:Disease resistance protein n=1 Tax=Sesamum alatum TaxID=300844 RepID=A0AAE1XMG8_9LAMI|nr:putative disease resistance protein [Sesamum alatum]